MFYIFFVYRTQKNSYKGDAINGIGPRDREHDPDRLVQGYFHSAATLNYVRSLLESHFADIHKPGQWDLRYVKQSTGPEEDGNLVVAEHEDKMCNAHTQS